MMSREEVLLRAKQLIRENRLLEASWVSMFMQNAPDDATEAQIRMVRFAFFRGAQALLDALAISSKVDEKEAEKLIQAVKDEINAFLKSQKYLQNQVVTEASPTAH